MAEQDISDKLEIQIDHEAEVIGDDDELFDLLAALAVDLLEESEETHEHD